MIFITLGSQKFQFDRLLKIIDGLIEEDFIKDEVFAQIGYSNYQPKHFAYEKFLNRDEFSEKMKECTFVITHAGTGAIITALKNGKKVIAMPRLKEFDEHVDNHQEQIIEQFKDMNLLLSANNKRELKDSLTLLQEKKFNKYISSTDEIINSINEFINL